MAVELLLKTIPKLLQKFGKTITDLHVMTVFSFLSLTALPTGATETRSTTGTYTDSGGLVQSAAINALRTSAYINGNGLILVEPASTNICLQSENFGTTWVPNGSPTRTPSALVVGTLSMDLLSDQTVNVSQYIQTVTFTGNGQKAISAYVAQGSATKSMFMVFDLTASAIRLRANITWSAGVPSVSMATGTLVKSELCGTVNGHIVYRLLFSTTTITAANTNRLQVAPADDAVDTPTLTGDMYCGGVQIEDAATPSSYIPTTTVTVTRGADVLTLAGVTCSPFATLFQRYYDLPTAAFVDVASAYTSGTTITPTVGRAYQVIAVLNGTLTAAQAALILGVP